jgi:hypothetical protein
MKSNFIFLFSAILFFSAKGEVVKVDTLKDYSLGFHWKRKQKSIEVPFEMHANLVVVPLKLNESDTLRFLIDTGLGTTLLTDSLVYRQLNLHPLRQIELLGLGDEKPIKAQVIIDLKIQVGQAAALHQNLIYVSNDQLNLSDYVGTKIHGVLGYELFSNVVVTIDYENQKLILTQTADYRYRKRNGKRFELDIIDNKPYIKDLIITSKKGKLGSELLLDSGAGHVLFLDENGVDSSMFSYSDKKVYLGKGLNGAIIGSWGNVPKIQLGVWSWNQVPTAFPHAKYQVGGLNKNLLHGSIGGEFLRRYIVTFNYLAQYVQFKPISRQWKRSFDFGMSGLTLKSQGENFRRFVVETVQVNSPGEEVGILKGDEIWMVNGIKASEYQLGDIYRILKKKEGKKVDLVILRGQNFQLIQLKLRKLF